MSAFDRKLCEVIESQRRRGAFDEEEIDREFDHLLERLGAAMEHARCETTAGAYGSLALQLEGARTDLREAVQELTHQRMWGIIRRLRDGEAIDDEDRDLIRLWLVGDADAYVFEEQNLEGWVAEIDRLRGEIARLRPAEADPAALTRLSALATDAHGVALDIARYLQMRERVAAFQAAMRNGLDGEHRHALADVLVRAFHSRAE